MLATLHDVDANAHQQQTGQKASRMGVTRYARTLRLLAHVHAQPRPLENLHKSVARRSFHRIWFSALLQLQMLGANQFESILLA